MESQPQNPKFRFNPENFHPCIVKWGSSDAVIWSKLVDLKWHTIWMAIIDFSKIRFKESRWQIWGFDYKP